jgi:predicted dehydrogenase
MLDAQARGGGVLSVGMTRRFLHSGQFAKWAIDGGLLGEIHSFELMDGFVFGWPLATDFFFRKELAGGGTLIDAGVHALDQVLWWLGEVETFEYYDDNFGGVESECKLHLTMTSGVHGVVELSRTRNLRNTAIIRGERGELEVGLIDNRSKLKAANRVV